MIKFKLNDKPLHIPSNWDEIRFDQYLRILNLKDDFLEVVSVLSGADYEILKKARIEGLDQIIAAAAFMQTPPVFEGYTEKIGPYKLPANSQGQFDIQFESLAQFEDMRAVMKTCNNIKTIVEAYPRFIAIYLQKVRDGEYDPSKAEVMVTEITKYPVKEVCILGAFFYVKLRGLLTGTPTPSPLTPRSPKKSKQALKRSGKSSA